VFAHQFNNGMTEACNGCPWPWSGLKISVVFVWSSVDLVLSSVSWLHHWKEPTCFCTTINHC